MKNSHQLFPFFGLWALILFLRAGDLQAQTLIDGKILEVSSTKNSLILDRGHLDEFNEGLRARFYVQKGPKESPKVFLVAEGELVKSFPKKSYWYMKTIFLPNEVKKENALYLHTVAQVTLGRPLRVRNEHIVASKTQYTDLDDYLDKNEENVPKRLIKEVNQYEKSTDLYEPEIKDYKSDIDVVVQTFENLEAKGGNYYSDDYGDLTAQKFFVGNQVIKVGDIKKAEDKILFESMSDAYQDKVNSMKFGVKSFYRNQKKIDGSREVNNQLAIMNTYDEAKEEEKRAEIIQPRAIAKVNREGENWSTDLDDGALRRYFVKTGLEKEARRRQLALNELEGHEVMFHYAGSMISHGGNQDVNYQGKGYNIGFAYDLHLGRTSPNLKQYSILFLYEAGLSDYNVGAYNARAEETYYGAYLNYYFINKPTTLNAFIYLAGVGMKAGTALVASPDISKEYTYQLITIPALQLMTKYRFRAGDLNEDTANIGASLNFSIKLENKIFSTIDRIEDEINSKFSVFDLKYSVGMSVYF
jgi:hypothetical protein